METIENALKKDLEQIEDMLKNCKDDNFRKTLEDDRSKICSYLNLDYASPNRINSDKLEEIKLNLITNEVYRNPIRPVYLVKQNKNMNGSQLFEEFMLKDEFGLREVYDNPRTYIFYDDTKFGPLGENLYITSLDKNYIRIYDTNKISDVAVLVHELGHAKLNLVHINAFEGNYSCNFSEAYTNFLKLMFLDFIGEHGRPKDSFNLKYSFFDDFVAETEFLLGELDSYSNDDKFNRKSFDYKYKLMMSDLFAMYLYNLYKKDREECYRILNIYINNFGLLSDEELLRTMNINPGTFKNLRIVSEFVTNLNKERYEIKQGGKFR